MTWALCLNCGDIKFGAICPCPKCQVASTGDMNLDIAFSDHRLARETLEEFGKVVATIHRACADPEMCFWTFIEYISKNHPEVLTVKLDPALQPQVEELLRGLKVPHVTMRQSPRDVALQQHENVESSRPEKKRWWRFWT